MARSSKENVPRRELYKMAALSVQIGTTCDIIREGLGKIVLRCRGVCLPNYVSRWDGNSGTN